MIVFLLLGGALGRAEAPAVVLHAGDARAALGQTVLDTGLPEDGFDTRRLSELVTGPAVSLIGTEPGVACDGAPTTHAWLLKRVAIAEDFWLLLDIAGARRELELAAAGWRCLSEPAEAAVAARLHFLVGVIRFADGDEDGASAAFRQALRAQPALVWDDDFSPEPRPLFEQARAQEVATLVVVPPGADVPLRASGQPVRWRDGRAEIASGAQLIQRLTPEGVENYSVQVPAGEAVFLVLSEQVGDALVQDVGEADTREALGVLLDASPLADRERFYVPTGGGTWGYKSPDWQLYRAPLGQRAREPLLWTGLGTTAAGAGLLVAGSIITAKARAAIEEDPDLDTRNYELLLDDWRRGRVGYWAGAGLLGVGAVTGGTGLVLTWTR